MTRKITPMQPHQPPATVLTSLHSHMHVGTDNLETPFLIVPHGALETLQSLATLSVEHGALLHGNQRIKNKNPSAQTKPKYFHQ